MILHTTIKNTLGRILLVSNGPALTGLFFQDEKHRPAPGPGWQSAPDHPLFVGVENQLIEYLSGNRRQFEIPHQPQGTPFQKIVWEAISTIPYGVTASYRDIAKEVENPNAARAVGTAAGRNPLPVIIPCHRVIGQNGALTGYGGGLERKAFLLDLEKRSTKRC